MKPILLSLALLASAFGQARIPGPGGAAAVSSPCTPASGYSNCGTVVIDHTQVGGSSLTNYPVKVQMTLGSSKITNASCFDLIFTSDNLGATLIPWEQEAGVCSSSTGAYLAWVLCASCSSSVDTTIYFSVGNSGVTTAQNTGANGPTHVWDSNFVTVYHWPDGSTLSPNDSTSNAYNATNHSATATSGEIGGGIDTSGGGNLTSPTVTSVSSSMTYSAWFNIANDGDFQISISSGDNKVELWAAESGTNHVEMNYNNTFANSSVTIVDSAWHFLAGTYDGTTITIYADGSSAGTATASAAPFTAFTVGQRGGGNYKVNGKMDEVRVSKINRPAGWITADFNSQKPGSTFAPVTLY